MSHLPPEIRQLLAQTRTRVRRYVVGQGLALAIAWFLGTFWVCWALDYLPVRVGANEMPVAARAVLLASVAAGGLIIAYRSILRRVTARLSDSSLALLIERQYPEFQDGLITTVELSQADGRDPTTDALLARSRAHAASLAGQVDIGRIFDDRPWRNAMLAAGVLLTTLLGFAVLAWPLFSLSITRLWTLSAETYPRQTYLEMVGFDAGTAVVARGRDLVVRVRADAERRVPPPKSCTIHYRTADGDRGRVAMSKIGTPRDGFQIYAFDGKPFKNVLGDIRFDVVGNDQRLRDLQVRVVDNPEVTAVALTCERPAYTRLSTAQLDYFPGIRVSHGSRVTLLIQANKPLVRAEVAFPEGLPSDAWPPDEVPPPGTMDEDRTGGPTDRPTAVGPNAGDTPVWSLTPVSDAAAGGSEPERSQCAWTIPRLDRDCVCLVTLLDEDGIASASPYRISIAAQPDFPPTVSVRLEGIGNAITPDARLPMSGELQDDYGVAESWFELAVSNDELRTFPFERSGNPAADQLDLRFQRISGEPPLELSVGQTHCLVRQSLRRIRFGRRAASRTVGPLRTGSGHRRRTYRTVGSPRIGPATSAGTNRQ